MISSEKEVLEIEDFYKSILDNIIDGVWVTNADDIIYYTNKGMENIAGIPAKQIVGSQVLKDFPENTLKYFRPHYQKAKDTLKSVFYDAVPVTTPSGMPSYQSGWLIPRIKEGKYDGIICTVDDVTERKKAEEKLKESEAQLREINVELDQRVEERTIKLKESEHNLKERVKELNCLYDISQLLERSDISLDELFKGTLDLIPLAWQFPGLTCAKIIYDTKIFQTDNFKETKYKLTTSLRINEKLLQIEVYYLEDQPFLEEEKLLISDIGNRLKAKIEQQESRLKLEKERNNLFNILNTIGSGVYIVNSQFDVEFFNPALERELGSLNGKKCYDYFLNRSEPCPDCVNISIFEGETLRQEFFTSKINKTFEITSTPLFNPDGSISKLGLFYDITERKIAEQELDASEIKYRTIFEDALNPILIVDENSKYIDVNKAACEFLESNKEEILGKVVWDYTPPLILEEQKRTHAPFYSRRILETKYLVNGKIKTLLLNVVPFEVAGKKFLYGIGQNITDRLKAEQKLKESEEKFRSIFEYAAVGIAQVDLDGSFIRINQKFCDILKYSQEELLSLWFPEITHPDDLEESIIVKNKLLDGEISTYSTEKRYICKDGSVVLINLTIALLQDSSQNPKYFITIIEDISDKKEFEEERNKFFNLPLHLLIIAGLDGIIKRVNPGWTEKLGYEAEELEGKNFLELVHPDDRAATDSEMENLSKGITTFNFENRYRHKKGNYRTLAWAATSDPEKGVVYAIAHDITERKKAEQKLKESEEKYRTLFENSPYAVGLINTKGVIIQGNSKIEKVFGYKKEEFIGQSFNKFPLFSKEHNALVLKSFNKLIKGEIPEPQELQLHKKDGSIIWVSMQPSIVKLKNETLFQVITQDISKIKEAELKLRESEERYRLLFESSPVGIGIVDFEGNVYAMNHTMEKITGYTLEESKQLNISSTYADPGERRKVLDSLEESGRLRNYEVNLRRKDGTLYNAILSIEIEEMEGKTFLITNIQDITEIKRAEEKLKELNKLKSELLRRTSHELKTPLVSIKGFSDLLLEVHREQLDDYILNTIEEIKKGCIRLETLISDILKTSELESGTIQLNKSEENLSFLILYCVNELKGLYKLRNHKVIANIPDNLMVTMEKEQIHQVISNLLSNSIKFTTPNGKIEINSKTVNNFVVISIKDNGIGFAEEEKDKIFKQFGKIERFGLGYDVISEGTGLGLYISKKIIELHDGEIWMESEGKNKGSTFYFSLPI